MTITLEHGDAEANGVRLHYVRAGTGELVILLHGWPQTWRAWEAVIPRLADTYTVIAPDLRGFGDSDKPDGGYDKKTVADDVRALVRGLGFERIHLVGHDVGATVIYPYAARYPDEIASLTFVDVPALGIADIPLPFDAWHFGFHQTPGLPEILTKGREREYLLHFFGTAYPGAIDEEQLAAYVEAYSQPGAMRAGFEHYRAFGIDAADNAALKSKRLSMPVLCIGGEVLFGDYAHRAMRTVCDDISGVVIPGVGHWLPEEAPDQVTAELLGVFARGARPAA